MIAIVTGASSGIGREIAIKLLSLDYKVYGIGRYFKDKIVHDNFVETILDLENIDDISLCATNILQNEISIDLLVNGAGWGDFKQLEDFNIKQIDSMININLKAPLLLSNLFLKSLKKSEGTIINITSIEATQHSRFSTIYTATKAGLRAFGLTLFEEARKSGIRVSTINPDITNTNFFNKLNFQPSDDKSSYLLAEQIANSVAFILKDKNQVITELTVRAQRFKLNKK